MKLLWSVVAVATAALVLTGAMLDVALAASGAQDMLFGALVAMCGVVTLGAAGSVALVWRRLIRPFAQLRRAADDVAAGRYGTRIPAVGPAELADLGRSTELMRMALVKAVAERERLWREAEQERATQRQVQSERLESLGQLVGGVAHDLNNLINVIQGYADFGVEQISALAEEDARLRTAIEDIDQVRLAAQQAARLVTLLTRVQQAIVPTRIPPHHRQPAAAPALPVQSTGRHDRDQPAHPRPTP